MEKPYVYYFLMEIELVDRNLHNMPDVYRFQPDCSIAIDNGKLK
jgi:hypothetical protein